MSVNPNDVIATISIKLHANGAMSIEGNLGDAQLAMDMLHHAEEAVRNQLSRRKSEIIIPSRDVSVVQNPAYPTVPLGDMKR